MSIIENTIERKILSDMYHSLIVKLENLERSKPKYMNDFEYYFLLEKVSRKIHFVENTLLIGEVLQWQGIKKVIN